jgi:4-hydroxy-tetrahydrodipicolinate synthase
MISLAISSTELRGLMGTVTPPGDPVSLHETEPSESPREAEGVIPEATVGNSISVENGGGPVGVFPSRVLQKGVEGDLRVVDAPGDPAWIPIALHDFTVYEGEPVKNVVPTSVLSPVGPIIGVISMELKGIFVPNVTPFTGQGHIDYEKLGDLLDFWLESGVSGIVVNASTGEAPLLSREERVELIGYVRNRMGGKGRIIAGTGAVGTRETIELTRDAKEAGAEAALVAPPFFYRPTDMEVYSHFTSLATSVDLPLIFYNVPKFTGYGVPPRVVNRIVDECSNLVGIKDSSGSPGNMAENIRLFGSKISVLSGAADMALPTLAMGGKGAILAVANAIPETCVALYEAAMRGDMEEAGRFQIKVSYVNKVLVREHSQIAAVKAALSSLGHPSGVPRKPLRPLPSGEDRQVVEEFKQREAL